MLLFISSIVIIKIQNFGFLIMVLYLVCIKYRETKYIEQKLYLYDILDTNIK